MMESMPVVRDGLSAPSPRPLQACQDILQGIVYVSIMEHASCTLSRTFIADHGSTENARAGAWV